MRDSFAYMFSVLLAALKRNHKQNTKEDKMAYDFEEAERQANEAKKRQEADRIKANKKVIKRYGIKK